MINELKFELYLENDKKERFDLVGTDFDLHINNLNSTATSNYDEFAIFNKVISYLKNEFNSEDITFNGNCSNSLKKDNTEKFILQQKKDLKLHFINHKLNRHLYCFVDLNSINSVDIDKYDEYEMTLSFTRRTNWILERYFNYDFDNPADYPIYWTYGESRPVIYSKTHNVYSAVTITIDNNGHDPAPFLITLPDGANNIKWMLRDSQGVLVDEVGWEFSGELDIGIAHRFYIDTFNNTIYSELNDYSYLREKTKMNFFDIPIGNYTLFIEGVASKVGVVLYEQYNKI